jgi:hypothetical protein
MEEIIQADDSTGIYTSKVVMPSYCGCGYAFKQSESRKGASWLASPPSHQNRARLF